MKFVTRTITTYDCIFGVPNMLENKFDDVIRIRTTEKPGMRTINKICPKGYTYIMSEEITESLKMPVDLFVETANEWMRDHVDEAKEPYEVQESDEAQETEETINN